MPDKNKYIKNKKPAYRSINDTLAEFLLSNEVAANYILQLATTS